MQDPDTELRIIALDKAVDVTNYCGGPNNPGNDVIVARAQKFYDFLSEKPVDPEGQVLQGDPPNALSIIDRTAGPHSRSCGITPHPHGSRCGKDCPTCSGE